MGKVSHYSLKGGKGPFILFEKGGKRAFAQPKKREGRVVLVETKRFEKGGTSIKGRDIGGGRPTLV